MMSTIKVPVFHFCLQTSICTVVDPKMDHVRAVRHMRCTVQECLTQNTKVANLTTMFCSCYCLTVSHFLFVSPCRVHQSTAVWLQYFYSCSYSLFMLIMAGRSMKSCCGLLKVCYANKKACVTTAFYMRFLRALEASMGVHDGNVLLHIIMPFTHKISLLRSVNTIPCPPNCTSMLQLPDVSIIKCFKQLHRKCV